MSSPSITAVLTVYNGEAYVAETLSSILSQTSPPDEIVVVDDGSTDGTQLELAPFRSAIRIVRQANRGHPGGYNRAFAEARGDYVARCDADDIWEPDKLERQSAALIAHPEIDIAAGAAWVFGRTEGLLVGPGLFALPPGEGVLENQAFARDLYRSNMLCASSTLIRRRLFERIGPFTERLACEDYDFWLRAAGANAVFFYDPQIVVRYRRHSGNFSNDSLGMWRATRFVHGRHRALADDRRLISEALAADRYRIGRLLVDHDPCRARAEFLGALRHRPGPRAVAWAAALSVPHRYRPALVARLVATKRGALARWDALHRGWA